MPCRIKHIAAEVWAKRLQAACRIQAALFHIRHPIVSLLVGDYHTHQDSFGNSAKSHHQNLEQD